MGLWWTDRETTVKTANHPGASLSLPWWQVALFFGQVSAQLKTAKFITNALVVNELDPRCSLAPLAGAGEAETCLQQRRGPTSALKTLKLQSQPRSHGQTCAERKLLRGEIADQALVSKCFLLLRDQNLGVFAPQGSAEVQPPEFDFHFAAICNA